MRKERIMGSSTASVLAGALALGVLAACATTDTGTTPATTVEARDRVRDMDTAGRWTRPDAATVVEPEWWQVFGDEELSRLIDEAIAENIDLRILTYRIDQAELGVRSARQGGMPHFSADIGGSSSTQRVEGLSTTTRQYDGGISISWEADIWGKVRQQTAATAAEVRATEADWRAGYLVLVREVASSYFQLRTLEEQSQIHTRALGWAQEALRVYERQLANRLITRDATTAQKAEVLRIEREIEELRRQREIEINTLAVLLGKMPGTLALEPASLRERVQLPSVDTGVSANLLERRPDVVAADERLSAAYRVTESRRAARLPTVTLGLSGGASGGFANPTAFVASFLPRISFPALDPQTKIDLKLSEVDLKEARDRYTQTVLRAVQEAENAIIDLRSRSSQLETEHQRRELLDRAMRDVDARLKAGMATRLEVLEASRSLLLTEQEELQLYSFALLDTVRLYNSLGGGW
jgi:NodT family efflux transporter outer membrane factor (OMF) lipoprotein